ncbi:MAG TPA: Cof-type HAD-IIB family hydrolase [Oscillatoriaceae cyanobacterium]
MPYRLLATDLDGTLFGHDLVVSPRTRAALDALRARGCALALVTGRMYRATLPIAQSLGVDTPLVTYQGAWIQSPAAPAPLWHRPLPLAIAREAIAALEATGMHLNVYVDDRLYLRRLTEAAASYTALARIEPEVVGDWETALSGAPTKLVAIGDEAEVLRQLDVLKARFGAQLFITQSQPTFLEIAHPEVNKGAALARLAAHLGVAREEVVAVGDGLNDAEMIAYAGLGVAMGDARPGLKAIADRVTKPLAEDGVAVLIEELIAEGAI